MKEKMVLVFLLGILLFPAISADSIMPGYHPITVTNKITNINEFPNYIFVSGNPINTGGPGIGMCPLKLVEENGIISGTYYKLCSLSVFVIEKDKWNIEEAQKFMENYQEAVTMEDYKEFMRSIGAKEVIKEVNHYVTVSDSSGITEKNNHYTIDLQKVKLEPDEQKTEFNYLSFWPLIISLIALILIIMALIKEKK